ncbi:hypothetical protein QBC38DRAFT_525004 [Podospora fimiseda]|uniref:Uncharacterized protein n=1 Tax=Podospora fimiseda TaxID=252190 RepID=A0AAN6YLI2_9PEZI|nr:hypothetical protein QBC38DRAFT_525004 [Podospora fimiseda]
MFPARYTKVLVLWPWLEKVFGVDELFTNCEAISFINGSLLVELPLTNESALMERLQTLPAYYEGLGFNVRFHNWPLLEGEARRTAVQPDPSELVVFKVDDVEPEDLPWVAVSSLTRKGEVHSQVSAGVLFRKGAERRLAVSFHNWDDHIAKKPELFEQDTAEAQRFYAASQGNPGKTCRYLRERIGDRGIGLIKLNYGVVYESQFMEFDASAKRFIPSEDVLMDDASWCLSVAARPWNDQELVAIDETVNPSLLKSQNFTCIKEIQGIYAISALKMGKEPHVRARCCGSVFVRCEKRKNRGKEDAVLQEGVVAAMFHFADVPSTYASSAKNYMVCANSFDEMAAAGWTVVPPPEQTSEDDDDDKSPMKRQHRT